MTRVVDPGMAAVLEEWIFCAGSTVFVLSGRISAADSVRLGCGFCAGGF